MLQRRSGLLSGELLLNLAVALIVLPILLITFHFVADLPFFYHELSGNIAISQLRKTLLLAYDIELSDHSLSFRYQGKGNSLYLVNNHLILTPGTQIIYEDVDDVYFYEADGAIYMEVLKGQEYEKFCLSSKDRFYRDAFLGEHPGSDELFEPLSSSSQ